MVHPFGVGDVAENKEVIENTRQTKIKFSFVHFSTGIQYTFYRSSHLALS
jgi:hypothetical protein